jgi:3D-(3,5/4)-trihydroxycyclohexane-1,2-dione acylhydrolase (decyclizing)
LDESYHVNPSHIDFAAHAAAMGARAQKVDSIAALEAALSAAKGSAIPVVIVIDTDPWPSTAAGGAWWDVAIPQVSTRAEVQAKLQEYQKNTKHQRLAD